jgi:hypothetical protein
VGNALPLALNGELMPGVWEDLANIDLVEVLLPVLPGHPPVSIIFELIIQLLSQVLLVVP